jgi:hypothetical protein
LVHPSIYPHIRSHHQGLSSSRALIIKGWYTWSTIPAERVHTHIDVFFLSIRHTIGLFFRQGTYMGLFFQISSTWTFILGARSWMYLYNKKELCPHPLPFCCKYIYIYIPYNRQTEDTSKENTPTLNKARSVARLSSPRPAPSLFSSFRARVCVCVCVCVCPQARKSSLHFFLTWAKLPCMCVCWRWKYLSEKPRRVSRDQVHTQPRWVFLLLLTAKKEKDRRKEGREHDRKREGDQEEEGIVWRARSTRVLTR